MICVATAKVNKLDQKRSIFVLDRAGSEAHLRCTECSRKDRQEGGHAPACAARLQPLADEDRNPTRRRSNGGQLDAEGA